MISRNSLTLAKHHIKWLNNKKQQYNLKKSPVKTSWEGAADDNDADDNIFILMFISGGKYTYYSY